METLFPIVVGIAFFAFLTYPYVVFKLTGKNVYKIDDDN